MTEGRLAFISGKGFTEMICNKNTFNVVKPESILPICVETTDFRLHILSEIYSSFYIVSTLQEFDTEATLHSKIFWDDISARKLSASSKTIPWRKKFAKDLSRSVVYNSLSATVDKFGKFVSS